MSTERFNELLNGPLHHSLPMFAIQRLAIALRVVMEACGKEADKALESHCADRQAKDERS